MIHVVITERTKNLLFRAAALAKHPDGANLTALQDDCTALPDGRFSIPLHLRTAHMVLNEFPGNNLDECLAALFEMFLLFEQAPEGGLVA